MSDAATKRIRAVELLRNAIIEGVLQPGQALRQKELATDFGISMTPVREALLSLEADGVLVHQPYKGVHIPEATITELKEVCAVRCELEALAARVGTLYISEASICTMKTLHQHMAHDIQQHDLAQLRKHNHEFHLTLYRASGYTNLLRMISNLWARSPWHSFWSTTDRMLQAQREHARLIELILARDTFAINDMTKTHIKNAFEVVFHGPGPTAS